MVFFDLFNFPNIVQSFVILDRYLYSEVSFFEVRFFKVGRYWSSENLSWNVVRIIAIWSPNFVQVGKGWSKPLSTRTKFWEHQTVEFCPYCDFYFSGINQRKLHDCVFLPYFAGNHLYCLCRINSENTGSIQRIKVYRVFHVHNLYYMVGLYTYLFHNRTTCCITNYLNVYHNQVSTFLAMAVSKEEPKSKGAVTDTPMDAVAQHSKIFF